VAKDDRVTDADIWPRHALWRAVFSPPFIYATIIVSAVIIVADEFESDLELVELTLGTIVTVWIAHVFSETVARGFDVHPRPTPVRELLHEALVDSSGILLAAVLPLVFLLLGAAHILDAAWAYWASLIISMIALGVVGWMLVSRRGSRWPLRLVGALATAALGALAIALKALVH
jgi:hypothetical protein